MVMRALLALVLALAAPQALATSMVEVLSTHRTKAVYEGVRNLPCRHRTSLCPDRCGHARAVAVFRVTEYVAFDKPGKYGDGKTTEFLLPLVEGEEVSAEVLAVAKALSKGDAVRLEWLHEYVTK
ncbi:MAG: hypothetical protein ACKN9V_05590, partial [Pseudomonadota bacterium]